VGVFGEIPTSRSEHLVDLPFSYSMSLSVRSGTLFALVKSKGFALISFIGLGMPGLVPLSTNPAETATGLDPGCDSPRSAMASRGLNSLRALFASRINIQT